MTTTPPQPIHEEYRGYQLMVLVDDVAPNVWSRATVVYNCLLYTSDAADE